jgi:hypothetical protein
MPRTALTPVAAPGPYAAAAAAAAFTAGDAANGNEVVHTGREYIIARNVNGTTAQTLTVRSAADPFGRTRDLVHSIPINQFVVTQVFPTQGWQQSNGRLNVDVSTADVQLIVVRLP